MEEIKVTEQESPAVEAAEARVEVEETKKQPVASNASVKPEDFDWDAFENEGVYGDRKEDAAEYEKTLSKVVEGEVVEGVVTAIGKREVVVNIGYKSEGVIMAPEFRYNPDLKVGDKVEVYVENTEDKKGQLVLSHKKARQLRSWDMVNEAFDKGEIVKGYVKTRTKGGMIVDVFGIEAFLPGSQIDIRPIKDYDAYVDQTMDFKIVKINQEFRNVVVSHKALLEAELEKQKSEIIGKLDHIHQRFTAGLANKRTAKYRRQRQRDGHLRERVANFIKVLQRFGMRPINVGLVMRRADRNHIVNILNACLTGKTGPFHIRY